jgi:hypothetical protein
VFILILYKRILYRAVATLRKGGKSQHHTCIHSASTKTKTKDMCEYAG